MFVLPGLVDIHCCNHLLLEFVEKRGEEINFSTSTATEIILAVLCTITIVNVQFLVPWA